MASTHRFEVHGLSDRGRVREKNQDHFLVSELYRSLEIVESNLPASAPTEVRMGGPAHVLVVADGVGGGVGGEEASSLAVDSLLGYLTTALRGCWEPGQPMSDDLLGELTAAIASSHLRVQSRSAHDPKLTGMATTLTMAFVVAERAFIGHVGDSRCYLVRDGVARLVTEDQTFARMLVEHGVMNRETAERSQWNHVLASAVGGGAATQPTILTYEEHLETGDALVLCSDGLTKHVDDESIATIVSGADPGAACEALVAAALEGGGTDNVTVVVGRLRPIE